MYQQLWDVWDVLSLRADVVARVVRSIVVITSCYQISSGEKKKGRESEELHFIPSWLRTLWHVHNQYTLPCCIFFVPEPHWPLSYQSRCKNRLVLTNSLFISRGVSFFLFNTLFFVSFVLFRLRFAYLVINARWIIDCSTSSFAFCLFFFLRFSFFYHSHFVFINLTRV